MISTVVFDLDDTLYDEIDYCKSGFQAVSGFLASLPDHPQEEDIFDAMWSQFTAGNHTSTFNAALDKVGIDHDSEFIRQLVKIYREHAPSITLPAESEEVLDALHSKYHLALLSDGFLPAQQLKVKQLGIEHYFKCIIYTEELGREFWKPSPVGFERIMDSLGVNGENCVYMADNPEKDFIAPNKLGFETIQLIRPSQIHGDEPSSDDAAAGHIISSLTQLDPLLGQL